MCLISIHSITFLIVVDYDSRKLRPKTQQRLVFQSPKTTCATKMMHMHERTLCHILILLILVFEMLCTVWPLCSLALTLNVACAHFPPGFIQRTHLYEDPN